MVRSGLLTSQRPRRRSKKTNSSNLELSDLTVHGAYFEPTVGIVPNRIKGWNFFLVDKITLFNLLWIRVDFMAWAWRKLGPKSVKNQPLPSFSLPSRHYPLCLLSLTAASSAAHHSHYRSDHHHFHHKPPLEHLCSTTAVATLSLLLPLLPLPSTDFLLPPFLSLSSTTKLHRCHR